MTTIRDLFPEQGRLVLSGSGRAFMERLGVETIRQSVLAVLCGENIRQQTEPLTRRRIAMATGAMVALFARGWHTVPDFTHNLSALALDQLNNASASDKAAVWPAQWLIGLTGKSVQNVLRSDPNARDHYVRDFEKAIAEAARQCEADFGPVAMTMGLVEPTGQPARALTWQDIARLTTAIGSATLTIRGSEKATYGKLFERLVLGSVLTILGFEHIDDASHPTINRVFWLSDSSDLRECDATARLRAGKLARFDIGFIGQGNPEIMKDKLTRYANEARQHGPTSLSQTFIIVDKMPTTTKTRLAAQQTGSEIIQMSMQLWPQLLAQRLHERLGYTSAILTVPTENLANYLAERLATVPLLNFLNAGVPQTDNDEV